MKKLYLSMFAVLFLGCQDNFDELNDTDHRRIDFHVKLSDFFSDMLQQSNGEYVFAVARTLAPEEQLRIAVYCYDNYGNFVYSKTVTANSLQEVTTTASHLLKDRTYSFFFLADIVRKDECFDYMEAWYQLKYHSLSTFHLLRNAFDADVCDIVRYAKMELTPCNQKVDVSLSPSTYNGFLVLTNTAEVHEIDVNMRRVDSFRINDFEAITTTNSSQRVTFHGDNNVVLPLHGTMADTIIPFSVESFGVNGSNSTTLTINNNRRRPFVITLDCQTLQETDRKFY